MQFWCQLYVNIYNKFQPSGQGYWWAMLLICMTYCLAKIMSIAYNHEHNNDCLVIFMIFLHLFFSCELQQTI